MIKWPSFIFIWSSIVFSMLILLMPTTVQAFSVRPDKYKITYEYEVTTIGTNDYTSLDGEGYEGVGRQKILEYDIDPVRVSELGIDLFWKQMKLKIFYKDNKFLFPGGNNATTTAVKSFGLDEKYSYALGTLFTINNIEVEVEHHAFSTGTVTTKDVSADVAGREGTVISKDHYKIDYTSLIFKYFIDDKVYTRFKMPMSVDLISFTVPRIPYTFKVLDESLQYVYQSEGKPQLITINTIFINPLAAEFRTNWNDQGNRLILGFNMGIGASSYSFLDATNKKENKIDPAVSLKMYGSYRHEFATSWGTFQGNAGVLLKYQSFSIKMDQGSRVGDKTTTIDALDIIFTGNIGISYLF